MIDFKVEIISHYVMRDPTRIEWQKWFDEFTPNTESIDDYNVDWKYSPAS